MEVFAMFLANFQNEPLLDFSLPGNVKQAHAAVQSAMRNADRSFPAIIGGRTVPADRTIASLCPAQPDLVVGRVAACARDHVDQAIAAAQKAFAEWAFTDVDQRAEKLVRLAELIRRHRFEFLALLGLEIGKDWFEAEAEIGEAIDFCEYYARLAVQHFRYQPLARIPVEDNCYYYIPLGVGAVVSPWNFPLAITAGMTMAAVVSGNTVVLKPSSDTPVIAHRLVQLCAEAGIPDGVVNLVTGSGGEIGDYLVTHPEVRFVAFTGSADVGLRVDRLTAGGSNGRWMTRVVAEMGGKNAIVVDESADLEEAVRGVIRSAFGFQGQKCSACSRLVLHRRIHEPFVEALLEKIQALPAGNPWEDPCIFTGPVANRPAMEKILAFIGKGREEGTLRAGGHRLERPGYFVAPTVFTGIQPGSTLEQEEIFGPVLAIIEAENFQSAVQIANDTRYGLTGAVFSGSIENLDFARQHFHCGNLYLNRGCTGAMVGVHPFGGFNLSGTDSKAGGPDYLMNFTQGKTVTERTRYSRMAGIGM
jgi:1-pyrroline-5-carboxylate dehydrogenase